MSGLKSDRLAGALLPHAEESAVVDILLTRADMNSPAQLKADPSDKVAGQYAKGKLNQAITVASHPGTSPEVLAKHAKDTRVSVRQALIGNPSTPYSSVLDLANWAAKKVDDSLGKALERLNAADVYAVLKDNNVTPGLLRGMHSFPYEKLAAKVIAAKDAELTVNVFKLGWQQLQVAMINEIYPQQSPTVTMTKLLEADPQHYEQVLAMVGGEQEHCSLEFAKLLASPLYLGRYSRSMSFIFLSDGAAETLLSAENAAVRRIAAISGVRGPLLDSTITRSNLAMVASLARDVGAEFTRKQEQALVQQVLRFVTEEYDPAPANALLEVLSVIRHRLPSKMLLDAMRAVGGPATGSWLSGFFKKNTPRPGEIRSLVEDPGLAFVAPMYRYNSYSTKTTIGSSEENIRNLLVRNMNVAMSKEWADEYASVLGEALIPNLPHNSHSAAWVAKRFYASFGTHEGCWETALTLASDWTGDVDNLISTTLLMNDVEPPQMVEATPVEQLKLSVE